MVTSLPGPGGGGSVEEEEPFPWLLTAAAKASATWSEVASASQELLRGFSLVGSTACFLPEQGPDALESGLGDTVTLRDDCWRLLFCPWSYDLPLRPQASEEASDRCSTCDGDLTSCTSRGVRSDKGEEGGGEEGGGLWLSFLRLARSSAWLGVASAASLIDLPPARSAYVIAVLT